MDDAAINIDDMIDATCSDNPGTGEIYTCHDLLCPIHGERNKEHGKTEDIQMKFCPRCDCDQEVIDVDYDAGPDGGEVVIILECDHHIPF